MLALSHGERSIVKLHWLSSTGTHCYPLAIIHQQPDESCISTDDLPCYRPLVGVARNRLIGECSFYWPYLKTLHGTEIRVPDVWSFEERSLLDGLPTPADAVAVSAEFYLMMFYLRFQ